MTDWTAFYNAVAERPPHATLLGAVERFDTPGLAVDLGCGDGRDTVELLRRGWRVIAIDEQREAIARLRARVGDAEGRLEARVSRFEDSRWPEASLVNSSFALPFCPPSAFETLWRRVERSIRPGGRFSGHLFGDRDGWAGASEMTFQSRDEAEALFRGFVLERFDEVDEDGQTALGEPKRWHVFHVIAHRPF